MAHVLVDARFDPEATTIDCYEVVVPGRTPDDRYMS